MKSTAACFIVVSLIALSGCVGEVEQPPTIQLVDTVYKLDDFKGYLEYFHPTFKPPYDGIILSRYLDEFLDWKLLYQAALDSKLEVPDFEDPYERESRMIGKYLDQEAYRFITVDEDRLNQLYEERFREPRVRIRSIFFQDERTANQEYDRLRSRPGEFESAMDKYNPAAMKGNGVGQGEYSRRNLPKSISEAVFSADKPQIVGPIDMGDGYLVVQILEFLDKKSLEEVRGELEDQLRDEERNRLRQQVLIDLRKKYECQYDSEKIFEALGVKSTQAKGE